MKLINITNTTLVYKDKDIAPGAEFDATKKDAESLIDSEYALEADQVEAAKEEKKISSFQPPTVEKSSADTVTVDGVVYKAADLVKANQELGDLVADLVDEDDAIKRAEMAESVIVEAFEKKDYPEGIKALHASRSADPDKEKIADLCHIDGIGKKSATELIKLGINSVEELSCADPEKIAEVKGIGDEEALGMINQAVELINSNNQE